MKASTCAKNSAALQQKEQREKRFLKSFDGDDFDDITIIVAMSKKGNWEIEIRLPSDCIRRRPKQKKES